MEKLITALSAVVLAVCAESATVTWQSGVVFGPSDDAGTLVANKTYKLADTSTAAMYVFVLSGAAEYAKVQSDGVYKTFGSNLSSATASSTKLSSSKFEDLTTGTYAASENVYAAILFTYSDSNGKSWYLENTAVKAIDDMGGDASLQNLARYSGGSGGAQLASWSSNVPEPTSAVLLLLGFAGLALKRKNA